MIAGSMPIIQTSDVRQWRTCGSDKLTKPDNHKLMQKLATEFPSFFRWGNKHTRF